LGLALAAFFLGMGIGAHALDELQGRPLQTRIGRRPPPVLAPVSLLAASASHSLATLQARPLQTRIGRRTLPVLATVSLLAATAIGVVAALATSLGVLVFVAVGAF